MATITPYIETLEKLFQEEILTMKTDYAVCMRLSRNQPSFGAKVTLLFCETSTGSILTEEQFFCPNSNNILDQAYEIMKELPMEFMELTSKFLIEANQEIVREENQILLMLEEDLTNSILSNSNYCEMN